MELDIVAEQYARMGDEELIRFAQDESIHLTVESFHLLNLEFEKRNLDKNVLESLEIDKALTDLNKQTSFEEITAREFTKSLWLYSFDQKEKGISNHDIFNGLIKKGVDEQYAFMLVECIESKSKEILDSIDTDIIIGWIILCAGILLIILTANEALTGIFAIYGFLGAAGGIVKLYKSYSSKNKYQTILNNIESEKNELNKQESIENYN